MRLEMSIFPLYYEAVGNWTAFYYDEEQLRRKEFTLQL